MWSNNTPLSRHRGRYTDLSHRTKLNDKRRECSNCCRHSRSALFPSYFLNIQWPGLCSLRLQCAVSQKKVEVHSQRFHQMNSHSPHSSAYDDVKRLYEAMDNVLRCLSQHIAQDSAEYVSTWMKRIREVINQPSHLLDHRDELIRIMIREKFCRKALMAINALLQNSYITEEVLKCIMVLLSSPLSQRAAFFQLYDANLLVFATFAIRNYFWSYSIRQLGAELIYLSVSLALKLRSDALSAERNQSWEEIELCDAEYHSMLLKADIIVDSCASQLMESECLPILPDLISNFSQSTDVRGIYNSIYCE